MNIRRFLITKPVLLVLSSACSLALATGTPIPDKPPLHLEKIISQIRKTHHDMVVHTTRLMQQDKKEVRIIDYVDGHNNWHRVVVDAYTGKEYDHMALKDPMPLAEVLQRLKQKYNMSTVLRSRLDQLDGQTVRVVEFIDKKNKRWRTTLDAFTGRLINEFNYTFKPSGKTVDLHSVLEQAKATHKHMVVLKTRMSHRGAEQVREIVYLDDSRHKKRLVVSAVTGEVIEDKPLPGVVL